jgi:hypothetical protein
VPLLLTDPLRAGVVALKSHYFALKSVVLVV